MWSRREKICGGGVSKTGTEGMKAESGRRTIASSARTVFNKRRLEIIY
jgi:hypothetical protein